MIYFGNKINSLFAKLNLALGNPCDIEQVVNKMGKLAQLPVEHFAEFIRASRPLSGKMQRMDGVAKMRRAKSASGYEADRYVLEAVGAGAFGIAYDSGVIPGLTGLIPGASYYLSASPGGVSNLSSAPGTLDQYIGEALSSSSLSFNADRPVLLAG